MSECGTDNTHVWKKPEVGDECLECYCGQKMLRLLEIDVGDQFDRIANEHRDPCFHDPFRDAYQFAVVRECKNRLTQYKRLMELLGESSVVQETARLLKEIREQDGG